MMRIKTEHYSTRPNENNLLAVISVFCLILLSLILASCSREIAFPASLMEMNRPEYLLKDSLFWSVSQSKSFTCYVSNKVDKKTVEKIMRIQEANLSSIAALMNVSQMDTLPKIKFWLFSSNKEKYLKTRVPSRAHTLTEYWSVYYEVDNARSAHEVGHLLSQYYWGYLQSKKFDFLLQEGFAFYVDEKFLNFDIFDRAKKLMTAPQNLIGEIVKRGHSGNYVNDAVVSAAFVKYLVASYGISRFERLWKNVKEDEAVFTAIYHKDLKQIEEEFYSFIKSYSPN